MSIDKFDGMKTILEKIVSLCLWGIHNDVTKHARIGAIISTMPIYVTDG